MHPQIRAVTFHTLIALMAATGIRTGEALGLDVTDFDQRACTLTVTGKYGKTRRLPLHPSIRDGLIDYLLQRQRLQPAPSGPALLVTSRGTRLKPQSVHPVFRSLTDRAGITDASSACRPRLHDLRHRFAVRPCWTPTGPDGIPPRSCRSWPPGSGTPTRATPTGT